MTSADTFVGPVQAGDMGRGGTDKAGRLRGPFGGLPRWAWISFAVGTVLAIALALAVVVLVRENGSLSSQKRELISRNQTLDSHNQTLIAQNQDFIGVNAAAEERAVKAEAAARTAEARATAKANRNVAGVRAKLTARSAALDARKASLDGQQRDLTEAQNVQAASTFSDGVYLVGTDIPAGSYVAEGGGSCYWERGDGSGDIIDNYFTGGAGQVRATIYSGEQFTSTDCGTWSPG